jgi:ATP-dependent Lhr-like helicase
VSRDCVAIEILPGGFGTTYKVLRAMEEAGRTRRGHFVEGLAGAQFAFPGAVDRLRAMRTAPDHPEVRVLSAIDPANAYGWILPWPTTSDDPERAPRRVAGATVVLVDGEPVLYLDKSGRRLRTFEGKTDRALLALATRALDEVARRSRGKLLRIEEIDGAPARTSPHAEVLYAQGFTSDHRGLVLEAS